MDDQPEPPRIIAVVGPCGAGKSTLVAALRARGYNARHVAQEHSFVAEMWQIVTRPDLLIYLDVRYETTLARQRLNWTPAEYAQEVHRLRHARQHAHLILPTDDLTPTEILARALALLTRM